jgi:hypothetical protein
MMPSSYSCQWLFGTQLTERIPCIIGVPRMLTANKVALQGNFSSVYQPAAEFLITDIGHLQLFDQVASEKTTEKMRENAQRKNPVLLVNHVVRQPWEIL